MERKIIDLERCHYDPFKRGDIVGTVDLKPGMVQKKIVDHQVNVEKIPNEYATVCHVLTISAAHCWRGYEQTPPHGNYVDLYDAYEGRVLQVYRPRWPDVEMRFKVVDDIIYNCNADYDWLGVLAFKIPLLTHSVHKFFCSEVICNSFRNYGFDQVPGFDPSKVSPARLLFSSHCQYGLSDYIGEIPLSAETCRILRTRLCPKKVS